MLIIIDEVSMVGSNTLLEINKRLQQIKNVMPDVTFGGVSVLAVGDLYQLPPIAQPALFDMKNDCYARLYGSGSLWVDEFKMIECVREETHSSLSCCVECEQHNVHQRILMYSNLVL